MQTDSYFLRQGGNMIPCSSQLLNATSSSATFSARRPL